MLGVVVINYLYVLYIKQHSLNMEYWLYIFPLSRLPEYICGLIMGFIIGKNKNKMSFKNSTVLEIISIVYLIIVMKYFAVQEWQWRGIIWIFPNVFLVAIFSLEKGKISKLLSNKLLVWLGNISFEAFLIHQVLVSYFSIVVGTELDMMSKLGVEIYLFVLTIIISNLVHAANKKIRIQNRHL